MQLAEEAAAHAPAPETLWHIFLVFLRLGLTSFGGPVAHLSYFREEFVVRRRWLAERSYVDLVALCQFLPGPASSQVGMALGLSRRGYLGALAAWAGFTLPSAACLILLALGIASHQGLIPPGVLHGLNVVAVAVVAQAVWGMARSLCSDAMRVSLMAAATCMVLTIPSGPVQLGVIVAAGLAGTLLFQRTQEDVHDSLPVHTSRRAAMAWLGLLVAVLAGLPLLAHATHSQVLVAASAFFRTGALVFGGGHVVLPLLQSAVVAPGWVSDETFMAGYGATQAMPGPLFTFAAFLGTSMRIGPGGWLGGMLCLGAIFAPSFLLILGALPFWEQLRRNIRVQAALAGINAAVVGLLLAALYRPAWVGAIREPRDFGFALIALVALVFWKLPPWLVVIMGGLAGWLLVTLSA